MVIEWHKPEAIDMRKKSAANEVPYTESVPELGFKFFTDDWLLFAWQQRRMAVVTLTFIDEHDRHFEHATPFNLPTKVQPTSL